MFGDSPIWRTACAAVLALLTAAGASAQDFRGAITGRVMD
jgi:hypothetical protein